MSSESWFGRLLLTMSRQSPAYSHIRGSVLFDRPSAAHEPVPAATPTLGAAHDAAAHADAASAAVSLLVESCEEVRLLVDSIARQTNLLAFNVTIEAARAGAAPEATCAAAARFDELAQLTDSIKEQAAEAIWDVTKMREAVAQLTDSADPADALDGRTRQMSSAG
jgi:methyl-accepting chemotaxis protein